MNDLVDRMVGSQTVIDALERADKGSMLFCHAVLVAVFGKAPAEADLTWIKNLPGAVSESIDGAVALIDRIRPGSDIDLEIREIMTDGVVRRVTDATIYGRVHSNELTVRGYGSTPALALCIAALRAHDFQKDNDK